MDLFDKKLSLEETMQFDSLIDNGSYDPHLILLTTMMKNPNYVPSSEQSKEIMQHIQNPTHHTQTPTPDKDIVIVDKDMNKMSKPENKNIRKTYIKLPNATIKLHKHKFKQLEHEGSVKSDKQRN